MAQGGSFYSAPVRAADSTGTATAPQNERTPGSFEEGAKIYWRTLAEYFRLTQEKGLPLNVVHNVGAAQVRRLVLEGEDIAATAGQLAAGGRAGPVRPAETGREIRYLTGAPQV